MRSESSQFSAFLEAAEKWYEHNRNTQGIVNTNVMNSGLIVSQMVADGLPITHDRLLSNKGSQIRGLSGASIAKILERHGETRLFTREGGRTSRGTVALAKALAHALNQVRFPVESDISFTEVSHALEGFFTVRVQRDYFDRQRIQVPLDPNKPVAVTISEIITAAAARSDKPTGIVLQHLVGAKLQLRFPAIKVGRDRAHAADIQTGRQGDFQVGTTVFHVTAAPRETLLSRCRENLRGGLRPVIITTKNRVQATEQMLEIGGLDDYVMVQAGEVFIGTNIEEVAGYDGPAIRAELANLIRSYNHRILEVEVDQSLQIEEPTWFQ